MISLEGLSKPIPGASPAGPDLSYEAQFQAVNNEIEKISRTGEIPKWDFVLRESARILSEESKDLRLAVWLVYSSVQVEGWRGLLASLEAMKPLLATFWDEMHPPAKRAKARAALVEWMWQVVTPVVEGLRISADDGDTVKRLEAALADANGVISERLGNASPPAGGLRAAIRKRVAEIPEPAPPPPPEAPPEAPAQAQAQPAAAPRAEAPATSTQAHVPQVAAPTASAPAGLDEGVAQLQQWGSSLGQLAYHCRQASPSAAWPYRLARVAAWVSIDAAPATSSGVKTYVRAPRGDTGTILARLFESGDWNTLRDASEDAFAESMFWLDTQRYSALALERLGGAFLPARDAVVRETVGLVTRAPTLATLQFSNGMPFATPETRDWLDAIVAAQKGKAGGGDTGGRADAVLDAAREKISGGAVDEALGDALDAARATPDGRDRFRITLGVAQLAQRAGKKRFAIALYEQLYTEVTPALELWDPRVCAEFLLSYFTVLRDGGEQSPEDERQPLLFRRLLSVDPATAVRLSV